MFIWLGVLKMKTIPKFLIENAKKKLKEYNIDLSIADYRKNENWEKLSDERVYDDSYPGGYSYQWIAEKYLLNPGQYEKINSCYAMGTGRDLTEDELSIDKMCDALEHCALECKGQDALDIKHNITRSDSKDGLIKRFNKLFACDMNKFGNEQDRLRLLFLLYRFEQKFGSKVLADFLSKPTLENVDNSLARTPNTNGHYIKYLKSELEKELDADFIIKIKNSIHTIVFQWMSLIEYVVKLLQYHNDDVKVVITHVHDSLSDYTNGFIPLNKELESKYKSQGLLEFFYLKLLEHEQLCMQLDSIDIGDRILHGLSEKTENTISSGDVNRLKHVLIDYKEVEKYLKDNISEIGYYLWGKTKLTVNERNKILRLSEPLSLFAEIYVKENFGESQKIPKLMIIAFLDEYLNIKGKTLLNYHFYRAADGRKRTLSATLFDYNKDFMYKFASKMWLEVIMWKYMSYFYDHAILSKAREIILLSDHIIERIMLADDYESMIFEHIRHIMIVKGILIHPKNIEKIERKFNKSLQRVAPGWQFEPIEDNAALPSKVLYSSSLPDNEFYKLIQGIGDEIKLYDKPNTIFLIPYELEVLESVYGFDTRLVFFLLCSPKTKLIRINMVKVEKI